MPHFIMERYKVDVGKIVCIIEGGNKEKEDCVFYIKPQGSLVQDGSETPIPDESEGLAFSMMMGIAVGERSKGDPRTMMRSILGLGVMLDHHVQNDGSSDLISHLRDPLKSGRDGFCTISEFVPLKKVGDPYGLEAYLQVNGEEKLQMSTRDMLTTMENALESVGKHITLFPGDLIGIWLDGLDRPSGPGDLIEGGISNISTITSKIVGKEAVVEGP